MKPLRHRTNQIVIFFNLKKLQPILILGFSVANVVGQVCSGFANAYNSLLRVCLQVILCFIFAYTSCWCCNLFSSLLLFLMPLKWQNKCAFFFACYNCALYTAFWFVLYKFLVCLLALLFAFPI